MKTSLYILNFRPLLAASFVLAACTGFSLLAAEATPQDNSGALLQLQDQLDQQTKRLDRLYKAIGPHLAELEERAATVEKQEQEDKALVMERVWESGGEEFTDRAECSPTDLSFAVLAKDGGVRICIENGKSLWQFTGWQHLDYQNLAAAPNSEWVAVLKILKGRGVYLLDARTGKTTASLLKDASGGLSVAVSPDSQQVAIGNPGIYLWDVKRREILRHLEGHQNWVVALAFSADGRLLISGSGDSTARVWDVKNGTEVGRIRFPGGSTYVHSVGFSSDGKRVLAAAEGGQLIIARTPPMAGTP